MIRSLYVHVPFCLRKCKYCDFYSLPVVGCRELFHRYPRLLEEELRLWNQQVELNSLSTIYFGGGTPVSYTHLLAGKATIMDIHTKRL